MPAPILSVAQMRKWEKSTWAAGRTEAEVISRVGHLVTHRARQMTRPGDLILVLAGKGHNGDDARHTSQNMADREVYLINVTDPKEGLKEFCSQLAVQPALIIDGLFGIGLDRPLDSAWIKLVDRINEAKIPILAIDVPSGLNADSGEPQGGAIRATVTLTLGAPKRGLVLDKAWPYVGRLEVEPDIGLVPPPPTSDLRWTLGRDFSNFPPVRPVQGHKGTFGHVVIIAGSVGYHGAGVLAARGALRACPGLVTVLTYGEAYLPVASQLQAAMVHTWHPGAPLPGTISALVIGPGLAAPSLPADLKAEFIHLWEDLPCPVIVDASALNWLLPGNPNTEALRVITPHPGEAARLLNTTTASVQAHRLKAVSELSRRHGRCWVVLKGYQTMIGQEHGDCYINSSGNALLAQGGSGDVLAGYIGGLLAQPQLQGDPFTALRYAVWQHGAAADWLSARELHWTVEDLIRKVGNVPAGFQFSAFGLSAPL
jgi:ADP-dependent NAD(P)H-hydrate dehydratase / NAD(P)H-hydrate epimerase